MRKNIDPREFGLPPRTSLEELDHDTVAIVIDRKSRVIMADGRKIAEKAEKIKAVLPKMIVILKTTAPVCSKTKSFLSDKGIQVVQIGK